jgi:hypothetical protein
MSSVRSFSKLLHKVSTATSTWRRWILQVPNRSLEVCITHRTFVLWQNSSISNTNIVTWRLTDMGPEKQTVLDNSFTNTQRYQTIAKQRKDIQWRNCWKRCFLFGLCRDRYPERAWAWKQKNVSHWKSLPSNVTEDTSLCDSDMWNVVTSCKRVQ